MGRTKRRRKRLRNLEKLNYLDNNPEVVSLTKWMKSLKWTNETKLRLANFPETGRGVLSTKNFTTNDTLIEIPYKLLISYTTVQHNDKFLRIFLRQNRPTLSIHDLIATFLVFENHHVDQSHWKFYLQTLPKPKELTVIWPWKEDTAPRLPAELRDITKEKTVALEESFKRVLECIDSKWRCDSCRSRPNGVFTFDTYSWAYKIVNTRAVYVNPETVTDLSASKLSYLLKGDPSIALCPFLDMFNHSSDAETEASLRCDQGRWYFRLRTGTPFQKYRQVFISYGNHDNRTLFNEYGFCSLENRCDRIDVDFDRIKTSGKFSINDVQYKFIRSLKLDTKLHLTEIGISFNLRALFYVLLYDFDYRNWKRTIFGNDFSVDTEKKIQDATKVVLEDLADYFDNELQSVEVAICWGNVTFPADNNLKSVAHYLRCRLAFLVRLMKMHCV